MKSAIPTLEEIVAEFSELEDGTDRLEYLIELGDCLPEFPDAARLESNRVQGCQSNVWLIADRVDGDPQRLHLRADSDAPMVRGLVAILVAAYSGQSASDILKFGVEDLFDRLKLRTFISPMRSNGLHSMVRFVRALAEQVDASEPRDSVNVIAPPAPPPRAPFVELSQDEVRALRADFPILATILDDGRPLVYLDNAATTQRPRQVIAAISEAYEQYFSNVHRGGHALAARTTERYEGARQSVRRFLNAAHTHEILFTSGTTAAINLVARSWGDANVGADDEILLTIMEHHSNLVPWQQLAERTGCRLRFAPVTDDGRLDVDAWSQLLTERTRLVAVTAVSNVLGTINPIGELVRRARAAGAKILIDAAQAVPHLALDVQQLDADFLAFSGHKMLGPAGIGVLYGKEALLDAMPPFLGGGSMIRTVTTAGYSPALLPSKFEAGTPPIVDAIALGAAVDYLTHIGMERIHRYEQTLTRAAHRVLESIDGLTILGPAPEHKGGIATFSLRGAHPDEVAKVLDARGVAIRAGHHCAMPLHERFGLPASSRASFYFYNTLDEVDQLGDALRVARQLFDRKKTTS